MTLIITFALGLGFFVYPLFCLIERYSIKRNKKVKKATVIKIEKCKPHTLWFGNPRITKTCYIYLSYKIDNIEYESRYYTVNTLSTYSMLGKKVRIYYHKNKPDKILIPNDKWTRSVYLMNILLGILILSVAIYETLF